ncbi:MAG: BolA/IbaG family iron-sulfur metabolism protein [Pseudomonadales bacterium]|nr:BolA/IbaG family iron-sulfur metabolism protein [Pseudomonadales bacterium]
MDPSEIKQLLEAAFPNCEIAVEGGDGKFLITAIGSVFEGLNAVKRQQSVYAVLNEHISSGAIHAVTMRLMTAEESGST